MELLVNMVVLFLFFLGISILFSIVTVPIYTPTNSVGGFIFFLTASPALGITCLFDASHSNGCEVISHFGFNLDFPGD